MENSKVIYFFHSTEYFFFLFPFAICQISKNEICHKNLKTLMKMKTNFEIMEILFVFDDDNADDEREKK